MYSQPAQPARAPPAIVQFYAAAPHRVNENGPGAPADSRAEVAASPHGDRVLLGCGVVQRQRLLTTLQPHLANQNRIPAVISRLKLCRLP